MNLTMNNPDEGFPIAFVNASSVLGRYDSTNIDVALLAKIIPPKEYPNVLDVCCGFGRFTKALGELGYQAVGLDLSEDQISKAKASDITGTYLQGDMRDTPKESYDAIINMYTSFGYFDEESEDLKALDSWYLSIRPGGVLIMELADMDRARAKLPRDKEIIYRVTGDVTEEIRMDWDARILEVTYLQDGEKFTCYTRLYEKEKLRSYLLALGFSSVDIYGNLERKIKDEEDNLILVARK